MAYSRHEKNSCSLSQTTSNYSLRSAKLLPKLLPPFAKEYHQYIGAYPSRHQHYSRLHNGSNKSGKGSDDASTNSGGNNYFYRSPRRRLSGGIHHRTRDKLNLSPNQCKIRPADLEFFEPNKQVNVIDLQLNDVKMKASADGLMVAQRHGAVKSRTRATQTLFRESSAQTLPYLPGVSNEPEELDTLEIFKLPGILSGDGPPGIYEVEVLERSRKRWAFAKALKENFRLQLRAAKEQAKLQHEHEPILEAFEWEHWIEREEYIQECQMLRLELLIRMFDKREREMHVASEKRIQKSCTEIEAKTQAALKKNAIEYNRALRRLEIKHGKQPRVWRKQHISQELGDPSSDFHAPKMRYGVNPSRRHFTASFKDFDMRMDDLEKKAVQMDPKNLKCPLAKLREWSKPKEVLKEVEQKFCSDANLNNLYESLRNLRETSKKQKYTPACLKAKEPIKAIVTENIPDDDDVIEQNISDDSVSFSSKETYNSSDHLEFSKSFEELHQQKQAERLNMQHLQNEMRCEEFETLISSYEGNTIGWLMRFLSEEMCRLKEQRKLQFFAMMAKRERWHREAAEAGLRQKENSMRDIYESLYAEYDKCNEEVTNKFLHSILSTDIKDYAHQKAECNAINIAKDIDKEIVDWLEAFKEVQNPLNYHSLRHALKDIVMPDVEKILCGLERDDCIRYIINDVLLSTVYRNLESYDVSFGIANDLVDRLIDNDLYLSSSDCSSESFSCSKSQQEAKAIIRKVVRYAVPGRRWQSDEERITTENIRDLLDNVFEKVFSGNDFIDVDMESSPNIPDQRSYTDLLYSDNVKKFTDNLEEHISIEYLEEVKLSTLHHKCESATPKVTHSLKNTEILLLTDPDILPSNDVFIRKNMYIFPESEPTLSEVRSIPSSHDLHKTLGDFSATPIYAPSSSTEVFAKTPSEEEQIFLKEIPTPFTYESNRETEYGVDPSLSSSQEYFREEFNTEEKKDVQLEEIRQFRNHFLEHSMEEEEVSVSNDTQAEFSIPNSSSDFAITRDLLE